MCILQRPSTCSWALKEYRRVEAPVKGSRGFAAVGTGTICPCKKLYMSSKSLEVFKKCIDVALRDMV